MSRHLAFARRLRLRIDLRAPSSPALAQQSCRPSTSAASAAPPARRARAPPDRSTAQPATAAPARASRPRRRRSSRAGRRRCPTASRPSSSAGSCRIRWRASRANISSEKINIVDTEDAVKYMPSLFVRKRNNGDTQARAADPHLGLLLRAQPRLRRRPAAHRAHRQRQHHGAAALGPRRAGGNRARRLSLRPVLGAISRQLDGRRAEDHDAHAGEARSHRQGDDGRDPGLLAVGNEQDLRQQCDEQVTAATRSATSPSSSPATGSAARSSR